MGNSAWTKSTRCDTGACVEVAAIDDQIAIRASTDPNGPILRFTKAEWGAFVGGILDGELQFGTLES